MRIIHLLILFLLFSCQKEEKFTQEELAGIINLNEEFGLKLGSTSIGEDYSMQTYFDLGSNQNVGSNNKELWDLGFSSSGAHIILNSAKSGLRAAQIESAWEESIIKSDWELDFDLPTGNLEDLCIGTSFEETILIDRGLTSSGEEIGCVKVWVSFENGSYFIKVSNLDNSMEQEFVLEQNSIYNYVYLNVAIGQVSVAPPKVEWDLIFTHYLHVYDPETNPFPYQVTGCLINSEGVSVTEIGDIPFDEINMQTTEGLTFSEEWDEIGFDWKYFDFDLGFITLDNRVYIIKDTEGETFKLRFTSFYDNNGVKGNPQFEFQKLIH